MKALIKPLLIATALVAGLVVTRTVSGDGCQELYGGYGGGTCPRGEVMIDKMVKNSTGVYVDNLGMNDPKLAAGQEVTFRLTVKNTSNVLLSSVNVVDVLPEKLEYVSGPEGASYNKDTRELTFVVRDLAANASRDFEVKAKVVGVSQLSSGDRVICVVNTAEARIPENTDRDTAQVCIERPIVPSLPKTGPAESIMLLMGSVTMAGTGFTLIKRARAI